MMKLRFFFIVTLFSSGLSAQQGWWQGRLLRADGEAIVFNFEWIKEKQKNSWYIKNGAERLRVDNIIVKGDSVIVEMPVFESQFRLIYWDKKLTGSWIKRGALQSVIMYFSARKGTERFASSTSDPVQVEGRWDVLFGTDTLRSRVGEFKQSGALVTGTILTPSGDYRFLDGISTSDSIFLSTFDGSNAYLFKGSADQHQIHGIFYSGASAKKTWTAFRNDTASVSEQSVGTQLRPGEDSLHFTFKDLDGNQVSIADQRFKNKVVVVQLMGSWCPNCMDETAFLSDYYKKNKNKGIEIVSLAYEYTTDFNRSVNSLRKFQKRFQVSYPMLVTGVTVMDSLRTEKTLPELTPIRFFPSSVIIGKNGLVRKIDTGFNGPATGEHYTVYKKNFEALMESLLRE